MVPNLVPGYHVVEQPEYWSTSREHAVYVVNDHLTG